MGFLNFFSKPSPGVQRLPAGTITVDCHNRILASTVSSTYSRELLQEICDQVLHLLREAHKTQIPLTELTLHFASLKITAREMRGGAIVFLAPIDTQNVPHNP